MVRAAFTMMELIFALVIMSIVFLSLPILLLNNDRALAGNIIQESILASSAKIGQVLTYRWDENSIDPLQPLSKSEVIGVNGGDPLLDRNMTEFRIGHFQESLHRKMTPETDERNATVAVGLEGALLDDIDDFDTAGVAVNLIGTAAQDGYKLTYNTEINITYVADNSFANGTSYASNDINFTFTTASLPAGTTSNLKLIQIFTRDVNTTDPLVLLRSYSANIGETDYYKRTYE